MLNLLLLGLVQAQEPKLVIKNPREIKEPIDVSMQIGNHSDGLAFAYTKKVRVHGSGLKTERLPALDMYISYEYTCELIGDIFTEYRPRKSKYKLKKNEYVSDCFSLSWHITDFRNESISPNIQTVGGRDTLRIPPPPKTDEERKKEDEEKALKVKEFVESVNQSSFPQEYKKERIESYKSRIYGKPNTVKIPDTLPNFGAVRDVKSDSEEKKATNNDWEALKQYAFANDKYVIATKIKAPAGFLGLLTDEYFVYYLEDNLKTFDLKFVEKKEALSCLEKYPDPGFEIDQDPSNYEKHFEMMENDPSYAQKVKQYNYITSKKDECLKMEKVAPSKKEPETLKSDTIYISKALQSEEEYNKALSEFYKSAVFKHGKWSSHYHPKLDISIKELIRYFNFQTADKAISFDVKTSIDIVPPSLKETLCHASPKVIATLSKEVLDGISKYESKKKENGKIQDFWSSMGSILYHDGCPENLSAELINEMKPLTEKYLFANANNIMIWFVDKPEDIKPDEVALCGKDYPQSKSWKCDSRKTARLYSDLLSYKTAEERDDLLVKFFTKKVKYYNDYISDAVGNKRAKKIKAKNDFKLSFREYINIFDVNVDSNSVKLLKKELLADLKTQCAIQKSWVVDWYRGFYFYDISEKYLDDNEKSKYKKLCTSSFTKTIDFLLKESSCLGDDLEKWGKNQKYIERMGEAWSKKLLKRLEPHKKKCEKERQKRKYAPSNCTKCSLKCQRKNPSYGVRLCEQMCGCR